MVRKYLNIDDHLDIDLKTDLEHFCYYFLKFYAFKCNFKGVNNKEPRKCVPEVSSLWHAHAQ